MADIQNKSRNLLKRLTCLAVVFSGAVSLVSTSAAMAEEAADPAGIEFFEKHIRPIFVTHCNDCHSGDEVMGSLSVDSRPSLLKGGDIGPAIVPGQPEKSLLLEAIRYENRDLQMPPQNKLAKSEIDAIEKWIKMGAPDPRQETKEANSGGWGMSIAEGREFWSFMPLTNPSAPEVQNKEWVVNPIDQFILAKLEEKQMVPAPQADKRTLLRRVTYNLIGLPPTTEEMEAFLADETPEAYEKVVDRLLASPHYGVHWGRHWLDVARYADSNGLDENLAFGNAWRYRDYVVEAYNKDKPFNRFVIEQLAGDLLPDASLETRTATGFLALGARVLAEPDREKLEMDTIDEQLDSLGKAFLGMTFGCVRCHDHKFDPVTHKDYYALAAIFKSTQPFAASNTGAIKHWYEHEFATEEEQEKLKEVNKEIARLKGLASSFKSKATTELRNKTRSLATEYLMAATQFDPSLTLNEVAEVAKPLGLHPRVLHHCRLHLSYNQDDPFFGPWHQLSASGGMSAVEQHYRPIFLQMEQAWEAAKKADPKVTKLEDETLELARQALHNNAGFLALPAKPEHAFDEEMLTEFYRLSEEARLYESSAPDTPAVMGVTDGVVQTSLPIHIRGSHRSLGEPVDRAFPEVMQYSHVPVIFPKTQSGRKELAEWIASSQHPLTARVYVNRLWRWHFGVGIVDTPDNFGVLGGVPSHPELLDWLARTFIENGWSTKQMHRLILLSQTYQMDSNNASESDYVDVDPENLYLWKFRMQRLQAEQLRDSILAISGQLEMNLGGKTVPLRNRQFVFDHTSIDHTKYDSVRRSLYLPVIRNNIYTLFEQFDFPDPTMPTGHRHTTTVAPQALFLMNADLVIDASVKYAQSLLAKSVSDVERIQLAYQSAYGRPALDQEVQRALAYLQEWAPPQAEQTASTESRPEVSETAADTPTQPSDAQLRAWGLLCQSLFAANEFIYVR